MVEQKSAVGVALASNRWRRIGKCFLLAGMALLALGVTFEIILRAMGYSHVRFYQRDPLLGSVHRPCAQGWSRVEGTQYVTINRDGFYDIEWTSNKPPGTIRIAVLGDSYMEAFNVPMKSGFTRVLQQELTVRMAFGGRKIEVMNFGVSGYGTAQELLLLRNWVWDYSPDIVLLAFFTGNDVRNNSVLLEPSKASPFFTLQDGRLKLDTSYAEAGFRRQHLTELFFDFPFRHLRTFQWIAERWFRLSLARQLKANTMDGRADPTRGEEVVLCNMYVDPPDEVLRQAWLVTEALLLNVQAETKAHGCRFVVMTLSNGIQIHPDPEVRRKFMQDQRISDIFYPDHRVKEFGKAHAFEVLCLAPIMQIYAEQNRVYLHGSGDFIGTRHWNEDGHRVAAQIAARYLDSAPVSVPAGDTVPQDAQGQRDQPSE